MRADAAFILVLTCVHAHAQAPTARLEWNAPPGCITAPEVSATVSERLGREAFVIAGSADLHVEVEITPMPDARLRAQVALRLAERGETIGMRELVSDGEDCQTLAEPVAVILAMMLNVRREDLDLPPPPAPPGPHWDLRGSVSSGVVLGLLAQPGLELASGIALELRDVLRLELELAYLWSDAAATRGGSLAVQAAGGRLIVSPILIAGDIELALRLGVGAGPIWAQAAGFDVNRAILSVYLELRAGLGWSVHLLGPLWLDLVADVGALPARPTFFVVEGSTRSAIFEPLPIEGTFRAGLSLRTR